MEDLHSKKGVRSEVNKIAGPVFIELLMGTLFGMVDMIMLGNFGDNATSAAGIASVGITNQLVLIGLSLVQALSIGATAMIARYMGGHREDRVESVVKHIILITQMFLAIPIVILSISFAPGLMKFLGAHGDTIAIGSTYFKIIMLGFLFQSLNFAIFASLRGVGDTKTPMKINVFVNLLNVIGNLVLIYGLMGFPALGVTGAGISTALSQVIATILSLIYILKKDSTIHINLKEKFRVEKDIIFNLVKIGVPASLEQIAMRLGVLLFIRIVASLGTVAYATHQIAINILSLSFTPGQAFGIAASTLTGKSLGADEPVLAEKYIKTCSKIGSLVSGFMAIIFFFFGGAIASLYSNDPQVIGQAGQILKLIAFIQPFQSSSLIVAGGLRGAGDTIFTLMSSFIGILIIRVALAYYFVIIVGTGLVGAWLAILIDQFIRWILVNYRFRTGKWKYVVIR
ncbi:MAG: MATE family efflux transporter [Tissierella sp.]|uniref:MATE family efflux transporter n=1 Tax=Tissierella sp. TaxID=41274 RepID=UPI003F9A4D24